MADDSPRTDTQLSPDNLGRRLSDPASHADTEDEVLAAFIREYDAAADREAVLRRYLARHPQAPKRKRRIGPARDRQLQVRRQATEQKRDRVMYCLVPDQVVVIQNEDEMFRDGADFIEQGRQHRFDWRWLRGLQHPQHPCSHIGHDRLQSGDDVSQKA